MGETTTLQIATTGKDSLRTTVPMSMVKHYKLAAGDKLDWDLSIKDGEIVMIVKPLKNSNGNVPVHKTEQTIQH